MILRSLRAALLPALLLAAGLPAPAQETALHTVAPEGTRGYVVALDASGEPTPPPTQLPIPPGTVTAQWQLGMRGNVRYLLGYRITNPYPNRFQFVSYVGAAAAQTTAAAVTWGAGVEAALAGTTGGILSSNVGFPTAFTVGAVRTGDLRWAFVFGSGPSGAKVISVLELEGTADGRTLRADTFAAISPAQLPATSTWGMLGIGYSSLPLSDGQGRLVTGDSTRTYVLRYDASLASGNRISAASPANHPNPSGFDFLTASATAEAGKFWVVGISSGQLQVRRFDVGTGYEGGVVWSRALSTGERAVPAFDPADRTRMAVVLYRSGGTRVVRLNLATGSVTAEQDNAADFSAAIDPAPVALVPGGNGYVAGKAAGKSRTALWKVDGAGRLSETGVEFDTQPHSTLLLESPERPELSITADSAGATEPGQKATFTVTRAVSVTGALNVTYRVESPDGSAAEGVDWDRPSGVLALGAGVTTGKIEVQTRALAGCKATRSFRVVLTNTDATLKVPEASQAIAASTQCQLSVAAPPAPVAPGNDLVFTVSRTGDTSGPYPVTFTTAPGPGTSESDYVPPASPVTLGAGQATASLVVHAQSTSETCRPEKTFTVTLTASSSGGTKTATGRIAAVTTTCAANAKVTSPAEPYLPGDELVLQVDTSASPGLDPTQTTWEVLDDGAGWSHRFVSSSTGASVKLQFTRVPDGGGVRTVRYRVPYSAGSPPPSEGTLEVRIADYRQLVRLDGPAQVKKGDTQKRRFALRWLGNDARKENWYSAPRQLVWSVVSASGVQEVGGSGLALLTELPNGVTGVRAAARLQESPSPIPIQELDVTEVPPPSSSSTATVVRYVPVALESIGVGGADWETELTLLNRGAGTSAVDLEFRGVKQTEYVGAGRQFLVNGLVERMREANPSVGTGAAPVKVTFRNMSEGETAEVLARTTTRSGADPVVRKRGRAGLAYAGLRSEELFGNPSGSPKRSGKAVLIGLRGTTDSKDTSVDRTNLAIVNPEAATPVTVETSFYGSGGTRLFHETKTLPGSDGNPFTQYSNLAKAEFTGGQEVAYATVERVGGDGVFTTYSTPIDNTSGDGSWVFPVPGDETSPTEFLVVPVLLEVPGDAGKYRFLSDLTLTVPSGSLGLQADYFWQSGGDPATLSRDVEGQTILGRSTQVGQAPGGVIQLFRAEGSGNKPGTGTVVGMSLVSRSDGASFAAKDVLAGAKVDGPATGDPDGAQFGRFGIFLPALRVERLGDLSELTIAGLRNDADVRSNLALYNPATTPVDLVVDLYSSDDGGARRAISSPACGGITDGKLKLAARTFCQVNGVLTTAGEPEIRSGYAVISRAGTDTSQPFGAYGVINDNPTNDGAYLPPFLRTCGFAIKPETLPGGQVNVAYSQQLQGLGGRPPYAFALEPGDALPSGMSLASSGLLSGTPAAAQTASFRVEATDAVGCKAGKDYSLTIATCPTITIDQSTLKPATVGVPYSEPLTASGGTPAYVYVLASGSLPDGLELRDNGLIQGTPRRPAGSFTFRVRVTDKNGCTAEREFTLVVGAA